MIDIWAQKAIMFHQGNIKIIKGAQRIHRQTRIERNKYAMDTKGTTYATTTRNEWHTNGMQTNKTPPIFFFFLNGCKTTFSHLKKMVEKLLEKNILRR